MINKYKFLTLLFLLVSNGVESQELTIKAIQQSLEKDYFPKPENWSMDNYKQFDIALTVSPLSRLSREEQEVIIRTLNSIYTNPIQSSKDHESILKTYATIQEEMNKLYFPKPKSWSMDFYNQFVMELASSSLSNKELEEFIRTLNIIYENPIQRSKHQESILKLSATIQEDMHNWYFQKPENWSRASFNQFVMETVGSSLSKKELKKFIKTLEIYANSNIKEKTGSDCSKLF